MEDDFNDFFVFNKRIRKIFRDWVEFDIDLTHYFKDFDESYEISIPQHKKGKQVYSISYSYRTGMNEPEIRIDGKAPKEDIDKFLDGLEKILGKQFLNVSERKVKIVSSGSP